MFTLRSFFLRNELQELIPAEDVVGRNRFSLFRIFTLSGSLVCVGVAIKMMVTIPESGFLPWGILLLMVVMLTNYFSIRDVKKISRAYLVMLLSAFALLHLVAYSCGGIRTGGILYYAVIILYAFMLLGNKGGKYFTALFALNVVYFYFISTYTNWTSFSMFKNDVGLINEDFLFNALFSFFLVAYQGSYLQSGKNIIIQTLENSKFELETKAEQLEHSNNLLEEYTKDLEKSNHELDKFASVASHDLKAPLRAIGTLSDFIEMDMADVMNEATKQNLQTIKSRVKRMDLLLDALLQYSKADRQEFLYTEVQTGLVIEKIIQNYNIKRNCKFKLRNLFPVIDADEHAFQMIIEILIDNATRFNDKEIAEMELWSEEDDLEWRFYIKDNGPGIEKHFQEKIFVIFQTLNSRDAFESSGAGLAIAKKIIAGKGGIIGVNSEAGKGAEFFFSIPKKGIRKKKLLKTAAAHS